MILYLVCTGTTIALSRSAVDASVCVCMYMFELGIIGAVKVRDGTAACATLMQVFITSISTLPVR